MVAILGTLGFHPETLIPTINSCENISSVTVFVSSHEKSKEAAARVRDFCIALEIEPRIIIIPDAFDLLKISERIQDEIIGIRESGQEIAVFNIAGGTRVMSASALLICIIEGLNAVYVHDETKAELPLPSLHIKYSRALTEMERKLLLYLLANGKDGLSQKEIADGMGLHKATINHHVKLLIEKGALKLIPSQFDKRVKVVKVESSMKLLLR